MAQQGLQGVHKRRRLSLPIRVSIGLVIAAVLPLLLTITFSELQSRPMLTSQANQAMQSDAQSRVQLINTYFNERLLDAQTMTQIPSVQQYLKAAPGPEYQDLALHASYALEAGRLRDKHYTTWGLFDPRGNLMLSYPIMPQMHGHSMVPSENLQMVRSLKTFISAVYYNPATQKACVDIYSPILEASPQQFLGFTRSTLNLDYIWNIVQGDKGNNGSGSYAFILDENGVRIADTEPSHLFKAIASLPQSVQQQIRNEARYGSSAAVPVLPDDAFAQHLHSSSTSMTFQAQPKGQNESFQIVRYAATTVPWTYFVLSPISTVTLIANQQLLLTAFVTFAIAALAAIIGLLVGRRITSPIMTSVESLRRSSQSLSTLATKQQDAASEQTWVVDSSQVGLQSVQYYTDATKVAARQLNDIGIELAQHWNQIDAQTALRHLERIVAAAQYIENAAQYQAASNQKLATALKVATQVTEQLATGATSATDAATQLERVVKRLRYVVGQ